MSLRLTLYAALSAASSSATASYIAAGSTNSDYDWVYKNRWNMQVN